MLAKYLKHLTKRRTRLSDLMDGIQFVTPKTAKAKELRASAFPVCSLLFLEQYLKPRTKYQNRHHSEYHTAVGHMLHSYVQDGVSKVSQEIYGQWKCKRCKDLVTEVSPRPTACRKCGAPSAELEYEEISLSRSQADVRQMISARRDDESKVKSIEAKYEQVIRQRDNYMADSKELGGLRAEVKRLKNQVERNKETAEKESSKASRLEAQLSSLRSKMLPTHEAVKGCVDLMRYVRNSLIFEGLSPEESLDIKGRTFHIYRRPGNIKDAYRSSDNDDDVSRDHMYYFRVETHDGVHFDVMPLASGPTRKATQRPISSSVTSRRSGAVCALRVISSSKASRPEAARVGTGPGETACTRMPCGPSSSAM